MTLAKLFLAMIVVAFMVQISRAETVPIAVEYETSFGQSVYIGGDHPLLGSGDVRRALKLAPYDFPQWRANLDLPAGVELTVTHYVRQDAPVAVGDTANFMIIGTSTISTTPTVTLDQPIILHPVDESTTANVVILHPVTAAQIEVIPMERRDDNTLAADVPSEHLALSRIYRMVTSSGNLPTSGVSALKPHPVYWRHNQAFFYDPVGLATAPSAARVETFSFAPTGFKPRTIRVLLPRNYDSSTRNYPVLYAQDGQNVFSPGGPFGSWDLDIIAKDLIARGDIPEFILVGIDNTSDRLAEYTPEYTVVSNVTGRGGAYLTALRDELLPQINSKYRTRPNASDTYHLGSSLGGLIGYHAANEFESTWGNVAAMSTAFWVGINENMARAQLPPSEFARLYIDSGNTGTSNDDYWNTYNIRDRLLQSGHAIGRRFMHRVGVGDEHNEASWRRRSPDVLRWLFSTHSESAATTGNHHIAIK